MIKSLEPLLLTHRADLHSGIEKLDNNGAHIVLVVDEMNRLLGTVTDGDVRRGILKGVALSDSILKVMNARPIVASEQQDQPARRALMRQYQIKQLPILNVQGELCGVEILEDLLTCVKKENVVVLMAGGLSTRLRPLTNDCPKPMLNVGGRPLLETMLVHLASYGFHKIYISINYLAEKIKTYFMNGAKWGVEIHYLHEVEKMGTAGALSLLPPLTAPFLVINSDLLTKIDFDQLLYFHKEMQVAGTVGVKEFDYTIPYGVCELDNHFVSAIREKPTYKFFINAGVYVFDSNVLQLLPKDTHYDMPHLLSDLRKKNKKMAAFPIREYWLDIGHPADFERAHQEYSEVFKTSESVTS